MSEYDPSGEKGGFFENWKKYLGWAAVGAGILGILSIL